jgi:hypothetical protein
MSIDTGLIAKTLLSLPSTEVVNANKTLDVGGSYIITGNFTLTIPNSTSNTLNNGDFIKLSKLSTATPILTCASNLFTTINGEDNEIAYNINSSIILIFNSSLNKWEIS